MKLKFNRQEMVDALGAICSVTAVRTPKDILKCVHLDAQADVLLLSATDLEIGLRMAITQVEVAEPGESLLVADTLNKIVRECNDEIMTVETSGTTLHVRGSGSHFQIVTQTASDFPPVADSDGDPSLTVEYGVLRHMVEWTLFAAARESTRYAINGVLWELDGTRLTLAATDGRRLSVCHAKLEQGATHAIPPAIVPTKALSLLMRLPGEDDAAVEVKISSNQIRFKVGGAVLSTSLVEGHFPKYQDVIPADCDRTVELDTSEFNSALRRAALLTNEESKGVRLAFGDGELTLSSRAAEQGEATISLPIHYSGEATEIGFNPVFLTDVLRVCHADRVTFAFKEANRPGIVRVGDDFLHVVMPVNLSSA